ncbi:XRE family transcriptional regulator [Variovorax sp. PAMC26660]|uniref:XRE family transcriptional regulator n=1 Tax=Variovorax sp. PAMC26660 TaxID=2762322 RepID=UPI00164E3654|nr:XRE family transcriptional regulator [Variovorax sp. PAMC26660]QNK65889.1 XRE family transcriptional regulator [Variovorax sp. PAMC26660]
MIPYEAPSTTDLQRLKEQLGFSGNDMADLASVAGGQQWRKYTGGAEPRGINLHMLFFIAARLALSPAEMSKVVDKMKEIGAGVDRADFDLQRKSA